MNRTLCASARMLIESKAMDVDRNKAGNAMAGKQSSSKTTPKISKKAQESRRKVRMIAGFGCGLVATAMLLNVVSPPPNEAQASPVLLALDSSETISRVLTPVQGRSWKYIYIHHSKTVGGDAQALAGTGELGDHFVICNGEGGDGEGGGDGDVQVGRRWDRQLPPLAPKGASKINPECISICLVGDFDRTRPTPKQVRKLGQLITRLQSLHKIPAKNIITVKQPASHAGIGKHFPMAELNQQALANP